MKKVIYLSLLFVAMFFTSCAFNTTNYQNQNSVNTVVDLSKADYEIIGTVEGTCQQTYVFGIGGLSKKSLNENALSDMYKNANLQTGEAIIYPTVSNSVGNYLIVNVVKAKATGYKVKFKK